MLICAGCEREPHQCEQYVRVDGIHEDCQCLECKAKRNRDEPEVKSLERGGGRAAQAIKKLTIQEIVIIGAMPQWQLQELFKRRRK